jgi:phage terminase small subunit
MTKRKAPDTPTEEKVTTDKQSVFIDAYMTNGFNATQAAITAGYSEKTARSQGSRLLTNVDIKAEIQRLMRDYIMPAEEVLSRLTEHARGDLGDVVADDGTFDWKKAREHGKTGLIKRVKRRTTRRKSRDGNEETETVDEEIELHSPQFALEKLGKYHGQFVEKVEHSGSVAMTWEQMIQQAREGTDDSSNS